MNNLLYECAECDFVAEKGKFLVHVDKHIRESKPLTEQVLEEQAKYSCEQCKVVATDKSDIITHILEAHIPEGEMEDNRLQDHVSQLLRLECFYCSLKGDLSDFYMHTKQCLLEMEPTKQIKPLKSFYLPVNKGACNFCGVFVGERLKYHVIRVHGRTKFSCNLCDYVHEKKKKVDQHSTKHTTYFKLILRCGMC